MIKPAINGLTAQAQGHTGGRTGSCGRKVPGNNHEFTQPIQMRFNELISGVRAIWR
jgi:hypothetical protein